MKKTLSIVLCVLLVLLAVACSPETKQHEHKYEKVAGKSYAATCKSTGLDVYSCTECGDTYSVTLPLTDHSHAEDAKPTKGNGTVKADCLSTGVDIYLCEYCGESFKVVTEKDYTNHVYYNTETEKNEPLPTSFDEKYYRWSDNVEIEATYFTPASKVAYCKSCSHAATLTQPIKGDNNYGYKNMTGTWIVPSLDGSSLLYIDVIEDSEKGTTTYTTSYESKEKLSSRTSVGDSSSLGFTVDSNKVRTLCLASSLKLSEKEGKVTLSDGSTTLTLTKVNGEKVKFLSGHNHKLNQTSVTSGNVKESIYSDPYFVRMTFLGNALLDTDNHYVECQVCGLSCVKVAHMDSSYGKTLTSTKCSCGYWKGGSDENGDTFKTLTIQRAGDPKYVTYATNAKAAALDAGKAAWNAAEGMDATTSNKGAYDTLIAAKTALEAARNAMTTLETEGNRETIESFLDASTTEATINNNLGSALSDLSGKENDTTASSAGTKYKSVLEEAENLLIGIKTDASAADGSNGGCTKIFNDLIESAAYKELEKFSVLIGSVLKLDFESFTSSSGEIYNFAEGTGWTLSSSDTPVLTNEGFRILKDGGSLSFCEEWK